MFKIVLLISFLFLSVEVKAIELKVISVIEGETSETFILKLDNGRVAYGDRTHFSNPENYILSTVEIDLNEKSEIVSLRTLSTPKKLTRTSLTELESSLVYEPTVIQHYSIAQNIMDSFSTAYKKESQCYDKAHVWAYTAFMNKGVNLTKTFLFFSDSYIRRTRYEWWFHVAPSAKILINGYVSERILDRSYSNRPLQKQNWTNFFMSNDAVCREITQYSEYSSNPYNDDCHVITSSMHLWQPRDLDMFERTGYMKTKFVDSEIRHSYREAFGVSVENLNN